MPKSGFKSMFQVVILFVFLAAGIIAVLMFGLSKSGSTTGGSVTVWGNLDPEIFQQTVIAAHQVKNKNLEIRYMKVNNDVLGSRLLEAIASGRSPDVVLLPQQYLWSFRNKITPIPYGNLSERNFKDTFVAGSEFLLGQTGAFGYPWSVDPLVLFWNRDHFDRAGIATTPKTWTDVANDIPLLLEKTPDNSITQAPIALGAFSNVTHAKDILAMLLLQSGVAITTYDRANDALTATLSSGDNHTEEQAAQFFESFADPFSTAYAWNTSLPNSKNMFTANKLSMYLGYASEVPEIRAKNPNLNFDITQVPQTANTSQKITYGSFYSIVIPRGAANLPAAYEVIATMLDPVVQKQIVGMTLFPSVRRDGLAQAGSADPYAALIDQAALVAHTWIDPQPTESNTILGNMVRDIHEHTLTVNESISRARELLQQSIQ